MKPSTRLTSAVFQLTPTRTRCNLVLIANDKKEKIASGLLNPFIAHLKIAQDQIAKGGYSILLEPPADIDAPWFTKATLERFVRFVSTPEVLERVYTIETEIIQIEEAIAMQRSNDTGQTLEDHHVKLKPMRGSEGGKSVPGANANDEKAIVLYQPSPAHEADGSCSEEGNSKFQLLTVLETRKTALQKEQGMAFARAVAAGFDIDHMDPLVSFARCFGATRLMEACSRFIDLRKSKQETGQWLDVEASESAPIRADFPAMNGSGIILSTSPIKHEDSSHQLGSENNGKLNSPNNAAENRATNGQQEYLSAQFPHLVYPPWPMHAPPGAQPIFQAYPVQGMPYYHTYAGPYLQSPYNQTEHSSPNFNHQSGQKRQSFDVKDANSGSETWEIDRSRSHDDMALDTEDSSGHKSRKKSERSNKKSGMVIVRNINYISSKEKKYKGETDSVSGSDTDTGNEDCDVTHAKSKGSYQNSLDKVKSQGDDEVSMFGKETDDRHWQAFQNCLLRESAEDDQADNDGMYQMERGGKTRRRTNTTLSDPLALDARDSGELQDNTTRDIHRISGIAGKPRGLGGDSLFSSHDDNGISGNHGQADFQFADSNRRKLLSRTEDEDFMMGSQHKQTSFRNSSDPLAVNSFESSTNNMNREPLPDETFIVPFRSMSIDQVNDADRTGVHIHTDIPSAHQKSNSEANKKKKLNFEPDCLSLIPERGVEKDSTNYDPALDYELQGLEEKVRKPGNVKGGLAKSNKKSSKGAPDSMQRQRVGGPLKTGRSKMTPLDDARARAERLRSYKADLQKMKKEQEEAEAKRLEKLKQERQKRIASRGNTMSAKPHTLSPQTKQSPAKLSPATRGSKFSDSEPGSSSPLQRSKVRRSLATGENKVIKATKLIENRLTRSASSSLSELKKESNAVASDSKSSMARIRRLSEPKTITYPSINSTKTRTAEAAVKRKLSEGAEKNKMAAIVNLDKSKAATLPELKIRTPRSHVNEGELKSDVNKNVNGNAESYEEESPIVEKTVLLLEKPSVPVLVLSSEMKIEKLTKLVYDREKEEKSKVVSALDSQQSYSAPINGVERETTSGQLQKHSESKEEPHSSLQQRSRADKESVTAPAHVKTEKKLITSEKNFIKESSKGLRNLLKFGKKHQSSTSVDQSFDSECSSCDGVEHDNHAKKVASSSEVNTLKNLISQDETSNNGNAPQKASRHFSLFSPFCSKTSEKKQAS